LSFRRVQCEFKQRFERRLGLEADHASPHPR
jgi:hypothetical protein